MAGRGRHAVVTEWTSSELSTLVVLYLAAARRWCTVREIALGLGLPVNTVYYKLAAGSRVALAGWYIVQHWDNPMLWRLVCEEEKRVVDWRKEISRATREGVHEAARLREQGFRLRPGDESLLEMAALLDKLTAEEKAEPVPVVVAEPAPVVVASPLRKAQAKRKKVMRRRAAG